MAKELDDNLKIPNHVAIIMDGNGRWAKKRMMPRTYGHSQGSKTVEKICKAAWDLGIKYVTVYAFSTENWVRPQEEVDTLMNLLRDFLNQSLEKCRKNNMRVRIIGDVSKLAPDMQEKIRILEESSKDYTGLNFQVALNYGGRDEILRVTKAVAKAYKEGSIDLDSLTEEKLSKYFDTWDIPDPDLLIRTSGEQRLSNYLLWQLAYAEFYFPKVLWPDFTKKELIKAIEHYNGRERRFGGV